jgi:transmembrane sensor
MNATERLVMQAITEQAQAWYIANREHDLSAERRCEFFAWLRKSPAHVREYLAVAKLADDLRAVTYCIDVPTEDLIAAACNELDDNVVTLALRPSARESLLDDRHESHAVARGPRFAAALAAAIGTLAIAILGWWSATQLPLHKDYLTVHGEQRTIRLDDGSVLHLNSNSIVRVDYTKAERGIVVKHGEALFKVVNDKTRPFRVRADATEVIAVGTEFDVRRVSDTVVVTVVEGSVSVAKIADSQSGSAGAAKLPRPLRLAAGQQARVVSGPLPAAHKAIDVRIVDVRSTVAWVQQKIVFERETLQNVTAEFNRYGTTQLVIEDSKIATLRITGTFNVYDLDSFVLYLETLKGLEVHRDMNRIRISLARNDEGETM